MDSVLEQIIQQTGTVEVGPSVLTFYTHTSDLILSILKAKTDNFYTIQGLPITPIYFDSYIKLDNSLKNDYFNFLYLNYQYLVDFDRILPFYGWINTNYQFLYLTGEIDFLICSKKNSVININFLFYDDLVSSYLYWFLNYQYNVNLNFLQNLRLFSNSLYLSEKFGVLSRNLDPKGFYFYFLYNRWDFEMVLHPLFSLWYQTQGDIMEDDLFLKLSGLFHYQRSFSSTDIHYFGSPWLYSYELFDAYYMNRFGIANQLAEITEYDIFKAHNNYSIHDFLSTKISGEEYLDHIIQYQPIKKQGTERDVADFSQYIEELNFRKQKESYWV